MHRIENSRITGVALMALGLMILVSSSILAQVKLQHLYKVRQGNRYEGVKARNWKPVSGTVKMTSFILSTNEAAIDTIDGDSLVLYFHSPVAREIKPSVYNTQQKYFMNPMPKLFKAGWNRFAWPAKILKEIELMPAQLQGLVEIPTESGVQYLPVSFSKLQGTDAKLTANITLVPEKDMVMDIEILPRASNEAVHSWTDVEMKSDSLHVLTLPAELMTSDDPNFVIKTVEKSGTGRISTFDLYLWNPKL